MTVKGYASILILIAAKPQLLRPFVFTQLLPSPPLPPRLGAFCPQTPEDISPKG